MKCDCCGSEKVRELDPCREYCHLGCENCGFERFSRGDSRIAAEVYENDADYIDDLNVVSSPEDLILWHHLKALRFMQSKFPSGKATTLDVGCFNGFFVRKLLTLGFDAWGLDFNKSAVAFGQEKLGLGSRISAHTIEELIDQGRRFDAITLFEVLEHLPNSRTFLGNVAKLLKDGGVLIVSTPNNRMCWRPPLDFPPHHLSRFTLKALEGYLSQLDMKVLYAAEQMSTYELLRNYAGTFFRTGGGTSLRGGEFRHKRVTALLRRSMNRMRKFLGALLILLDKLLYLFGVRYISQIVVAEKRTQPGDVR